MDQPCKTDQTSSVATPRPRLAVPHCDGVIWFGQVDWWYHNRGHASTRMATRVARKVPTVWINSIGMRLPVPGKTQMVWTRYLRKLRSSIKGLKQDPNTGMWAYSPLFIPLFTPQWTKINGFLLAQQVKLIKRRLGIRQASACISNPTTIAAVERLDWVRVVFDRCDDFTTLPDVNQPFMAQLEGRLLDHCDHAAYVNVSLYERERQRVADAQLMGHGVDFDHLSACRPLEGPPTDAPPAMAGLARPIVGFFGGMDDYRMDVELMVKIARHVAPGTFTLIGPAQMNLAPVLAEPNVVHIGQMPPEDLGIHAAQFDVGVIPFLRNEFNVSCNPTKLKEYLALAFPIVATHLPAFDQYGDLIGMAEDHDQFLALLDQALGDHSADKASHRREAVAGDSWDRVADRIAKMLSIHLP